MSNIPDPSIPPSIPSSSSGLGPAPHYLAQSILVTIFCCQPFGIVAIIFSAMTMGKNSEGNYATAWEQSKTAKTWAWVAFGVGLVVNIIAWAFWIFVVVAAEASSSNGGY